MAPAVLNITPTGASSDFLAALTATIRNSQPEDTPWADIFDSLLSGLHPHGYTSAVLDGHSRSGHFKLRIDSGSSTIGVFVATLDKEGYRTDLGLGDGYVFLAEHGRIRTCPEHFEIALVTVERVIAEGGVKHFTPNPPIPALTA